MDLLSHLVQPGEVVSVVCRLRSPCGNNASLLVKNNHQTSWNPREIANRIFALSMPPSISLFFENVRCQEDQLGACKIGEMTRNSLMQLVA
jgi:hypothetical protein